MWTRTVVAATWIAVAVAGMAQAGCQGGVRVLSSSMEPTLHCAKPGAGCESKTPDLLKQVADVKLQRGDIIAFKAPHRAIAGCATKVPIWVKRIVGLPGERWSISRGFVYINGHRLREPYLSPKRRDGFSLPGGRIPKARYFVLGDNRLVSCDSRVWGYVPAKDVIAHVIAVERGGRTIKVR